MTDALLNTKALGLFNFTFMRGGNGEFHHTYDIKPPPSLHDVPELVCGNRRRIVNIVLLHRSSLCNPGTIPLSLSLSFSSYLLLPGVQTHFKRETSSNSRLAIGTSA